MKYEENITAVAKLMPDFMGFIFYNKSKRFAESPINDLEIKDLPKNIIKVGVFVNASIENILKKTEQYNLNLIQLHGNEPVTFCEKLKSHVDISKAFGVDGNFDFEKTKAYEPHCSYFLFDTKTINYGGSGKKFNWEILDKYKGNVPFFIAGGLTLQDVGNLADLKHPNFFGVDINSGFEIEPGLKNPEEIKFFKNKIDEIKL